jgi:hypothetical protein
MSSTTFIKDAIRTESVIPDSHPVPREALISALRLVESANDALDILKKHIFYGKPLNIALLQEINEKVAKHNEAVMQQFSEDATRYQPLAANSRIAHAVIGYATEGGEAAKALAAHLEGQPLDTINLGEEFFDGDWYKAIFLDETNQSEEEGRARIIRKLKARYPEKFTSENAINRDLARERMILEGKD